MSYSEHFFRIRGGDGVGLFKRDALELREFFRCISDVGTFVAFSPEGDGRQPGGVGLEQYVIERNPVHKRRQMGVLVGEHAANSDLEPFVGFLDPAVGLIAAAESVEHTADRSAHPVEAFKDVFGGIAGMDDDGQVLLPGEGQLVFEDALLLLQEILAPIFVKADFPDSYEFALAVVVPYELKLFLPV